jgi:Cu-processing system permease protein
MLIKYIFYDILKTRFVLLYTAFLFLSSLGMYQLDADPAKVELSLLNILLIVVPLVSIIFTTIHFYNSYEFIEMMLSQPVDRKTIFISEYAGLALSLTLAYLTGVGVPMLLYGWSDNALTLLVSGSILTLVFISLAFLSSVLTRDKAKAIGIALAFWLYFALIYDAFVLWVIFSFSDYPLEKVTLAMISLNPVDLARILMILKLDISALMGYTGAFYKDFLGTSSGTAFSFIMLLLWILLPLAISIRIFKRKDL